MCTARSPTGAALSKLHLNEDTPKLLSKDTLQQLHTPAADGQTPYACGWIVKKIAGQRVIWHNGSNTMWYAAVNAAPETDTAVLVVCNGPIENQQRVEALNEAIFASLFAALSPRWSSVFAASVATMPGSATLRALILSRPVSLMKR